MWLSLAPSQRPRGVAGSKPVLANRTLPATGVMPTSTGSEMSAPKAPVTHPGAPCPPLSGNPAAPVQTAAIREGPGWGGGSGGWGRFPWTLPGRHLVPLPTLNRAHLTRSRKERQRGLVPTKSNSHDSRNEHARHTLTMNHQRGWIHADNTRMPRIDGPRWGLPESSWSCLQAWREALGRGAWAIKSSKSHLATFLSHLTPGGHSERSLTEQGYSPRGWAQSQRWTSCGQQGHHR